AARALGDALHVIAGPDSAIHPLKKRFFSMHARVKPAHNELTTAHYGMRTSARGCAGLNVRPAERRLHLAPHLHGKIVFVIVYVAPTQALALREVALEPDPMRKPQRQQALPEVARGRNLLAPDAT